VGHPQLTTAARSWTARVAWIRSARGRLAAAAAGRRPWRTVLCCHRPARARRWRLRPGRGDPGPQAW